MKAVEANFDGIIGPTHNYSGLSFGNVAAMQNAQSVSNPKQAALQGLEKMRFLAQLGIPQGVLPPAPRPDLATLRALGFTGSNAQIIEKAYKQAPHILANCYSASSMWAANAATVSASSDTKDGRVHFTPANLISTFHRSLEPKTTGPSLKAIFTQDACFAHHSPLPATSIFADEGAANFMRLCPEHGQKGVECFVYGRASDSVGVTKQFPARQSRQASETLVRLHGLDEQKTVLIEQNPEAIDYGVFHNDVIATANQNVLFYHERAFKNKLEVIKEIREKCDFEVHFIEVKESEIPLPTAVKTYLFNCQIVSLSTGGMAIIAPGECAENNAVSDYLERIREDVRNPIVSLHYLDVRESMRNGGGPACLRLRVVLTETERAATHASIWLSDALYSKLASWVNTHYRDRLQPQDLSDPHLMKESFDAQEALYRILHLSF